MTVRSKIFSTLENLKWYEWIGWIIEAVTIWFGAVFVWTHVCLNEMRAAWIALAFFGGSSLAWMWVLVKYHPERKAKA